MLDRLRQLIGAPERKASAAARVIALQSGGRARWTPRDYAALTREGFLKNPVVFRAVKLVAESAASLPLLAYQGGIEQERHPVLDLLTYPNPRQDGAHLFEALYLHLLLAGNAYVEGVGIDGRVRELYALRPDRMRLAPGPDGWPAAYDYTVGGRTVRFAQEGDSTPPILHIALPHPLDDHYGFAPLEAAAVATELSLVECPAFALTALHALWTGHQPGIAGFGTLSTLLMAYFGARFGVLGVYVSGRTREKQTLLSGEVIPSIVTEILKGIRKGK